MLMRHTNGKTSWTPWTGIDFGAIVTEIDTKGADKIEFMDSD